MDSKMKFDEIKFEVNTLIKKNSQREVTPKTKSNISGIYLIYIENFTSDEIVPIYVGQAKDIQKRYKQHLTEILALNRLSFEEYHRYFFSKSSSFYEGKFKTCKIFKYMIENKCTLQDFRMIILEEVNEDLLDEKEQKYFQRLLPSFFGFNQFNSFLKQLKFRFSNSQPSKSEIDDYLEVLLEDINGINSYYKYGFTTFNFEHSLTKNISFLLEEKDKLGSDTLLKYDEVNMKLNELCKRYITDFEDIQRFWEKKNKRLKAYKIAKDEYKQALNTLEKEISQKFRELDIYNDEAIELFTYSVIHKDKPKYIKLFKKHLKSKKCKSNFYKIFDKQIKDVKNKLEESDNNKILYNEVLDLYLEREAEVRPERYKMIFPSRKFESFSLKDCSNNLTIEINEDYELLNTCHINIYISNNGISRSIDVYKEPFIIRLNYCFIDIDGNKTENKIYIDNETTRNSQTEIEYFEKDFDDFFAFRKTPFTISGLIENEIENSFISIQAEYKHGINDYTLKDKSLIKLPVVLEEIKKLTDENTRFNISASESANCLKVCLINEELQKNEFVEQLLLTRKLLKKKKLKKPQIKQDKELVNKTISTQNSRDKRAATYKQKVLIKSDNKIGVINYVSSREKVKAQCKSCEYQWEIRSDHLLSRPYCPSCR